MTDHLAVLRRAGAASKRAEESKKKKDAVRDEAIRAAIEAGLTYAQIAEAVGLSRGRIAQMGGRPVRGAGRPRKTVE
jgi:hypothetical protein